VHRLSRLNFTGGRLRPSAPNPSDGIIPASVWAWHLQRIRELRRRVRRELKARLIVILITAFPTPAAWVVRVWNEHRRRGRERQQAVELLAALRRPAYAARAAKLVRAQEIMHEDTAVLRLVPTPRDSSVYQPRSHPLEDGLTLRMWNDLRDDTGDIAAAS